jgi:hypothetical protein
MNVAPAFFSVVLEALFSMIVIGTDKLFVRRSPERGLRSFLEYIEQHRDILIVRKLQERRGSPDNHWMLENRPDVTLDMILEDKARLDHVACLSSIQTRRDKFDAHYDKKYFFEPGKLADDAPLKWGDLKEIETTMGDVLNRYSAAYDGNTFSLTPINIGDVAWLLNLVSRGLRAFQGRER